MVQNGQQLDPRDNRNDGHLSLYGLMPKVETAIINAVQKGAAQRVRALISPLHPADQADLLEGNSVLRGQTPKSGSSQVTS